MSIIVRALLAMGIAEIACELFDVKNEGAVPNIFLCARERKERIERIF